VQVSDSNILIPDGPLFSDAELNEVVQTFADAFASWLRPAEIIEVSGDIRAGELLMECRLKNRTTSDNTKFEMGLTLPDDESLTLLDARAVLVEAISSVLGDWLAAERLPPPHPQWLPVSYSNLTLFVRGESRNDDLIEQANRLLEEAGFDTDLD
jgi:hypothetical protein